MVTMIFLFSANRRQHFSHEWKARYIRFGKDPVFELAKMAQIAAISL
jgi:hypothetical protein